MIKFFRTIPFWHRYTGPYRTDIGFNHPGRTWLDSISRSHDWDYSRTECPHVFLGLPFATKEMLQNGIRADFGFIKRFLSGLFAFEFLFANYEKSIFQRFILKVIESIFQSIVDIFVGTIGTVIFLVNIFFSFIFKLLKK